MGALKFPAVSVIAVGSGVKVGAPIGCAASVTGWPGCGTPPRVRFPERTALFPKTIVFGGARNDREGGSGGGGAVALSYVTVSELTRGVAVPSADCRSKAAVSAWCAAAGIPARSSVVGPGLRGGGGAGG